MQQNTTAPLLQKYVQDAQYVIKSVICDPNFERLVLGSIEADFMQIKTRSKARDKICKMYTLFAPLRIQNSAKFRQTDWNTFAFL